MYGFENEIILFLDDKEYESYQMFDWLQSNKNMVINERKDKSEGGVSVNLKGGLVTIEHVLELEDILDASIVVTSRFLGSSDTIRSLGLDY